MQRHSLVNNSVQETLARLVQLNQLEDQLEVGKRWKNATLDHQALIESLRSSVLPSILQHHDRLRTKGKRSVAEARHGVCSECHMSVAIGVLAALRRRDQFQKCESCGRYIFLPASEEIEMAACPSEKKLAGGKFAPGHAGDHSK